MQGWRNLLAAVIAVGLSGCQPRDPFFFAASTLLAGSFSADTPLDLREERGVVTFPLVMEQPQLLLVGVESDSVDTYLEVLNSQGEILASDDDHGPDVNPLLLVRLDPGSYTLRVLNTPGSLGHFLLGYRPLNPWSNAIQGWLREGDPQHPDDGSWMDVYELAGQARQILLVEVTTEGFSPFVQLLNPEGEGVAMAYGRQSPLYMAAYLERSGTHSLRVSSLRPGETGTYRLNTLLVSPRQLP
ncbi:MAG: hypothetical protein Q6K70_03360 [Thermostichales cyanobacterium DRC_bins_46]